MKKIIFSLLACIAGLTLAGCGGNEYLSKRVDSPVVVDGSDNDWQGKLTSMKKEGILLGVQNDVDYLYITLVTSGQVKTRQLLGDGLILWLDGEGGSSKNFGIKFPLGMSGMRDKMQFGKKSGDDGMTFNPDNSEAPEQSGDRQKMKPREMPDMSKFMTELEIYEPDAKSWSRVPISQAKGIEIKFINVNDRFVYEAKIALNGKGDNMYFVVPEKDKVGVGFETPERVRPTMKSQQGESEQGGGPEGGPGSGGMGGPGGGGMGGPGGGGMGGHGGRGGMGGPGAQMGEGQKQFSYWTTVTLAK